MSLLRSLTAIVLLSWTLLLPHSSWLALGVLLFAGMLALPVVTSNGKTQRQDTRDVIRWIEVIATWTALFGISLHAGFSVGILKWYGVDYLDHVVQGNFQDFRESAPVVREFDGIEFVWCPSGEFLMGSRLSMEETRSLYGLDERYDSELYTEWPTRSLSVPAGYWISRTEMTVREWNRIVQESSSNRLQTLEYLSGATPVTNISWQNVSEFLKSFEEVTGRPYRLPTEAEWEYAAESGTGRDLPCDSPFDCLPEIAWYFDESIEPRDIVLHEAGEKSANAWGLFDMFGNAWEFTGTGFGPDGTPTSRLPLGSDDNYRVVIRGGGGNSRPYTLRASYRSSHPWDEQHAFVGFRIVFTPVEVADYPETIEGN